MNDTLEVCVDASLRKFEDGRIFTCSGALSINSKDEHYIITPDSTNNRGELLAIYLGIRLLEKESLANPGMYKHLALYSDSTFCIYGLTRWMDGWLRNTDNQGVMYGTNRLPVKNQELFAMIITYACVHKLVIHFYHQKGHVNQNSEAQLVRGNEIFFRSNGFYLAPEDIFKVSFYNNIVDQNSRLILAGTDESKYPPFVYPNHSDIQMTRYVIPDNYKEFIKGGNKL